MVQAFFIIILAYIKRKLRIYNLYRVIKLNKKLMKRIICRKKLELKNTNMKFIITVKIFNEKKVK
nr:hypothetical protein CPBEC1_23780 [Clostridium perfringens]